MGKLVEKAIKAEERAEKVWQLYNELVLKRRSLSEIGQIMGITKARVHQIVKARLEQETNATDTKFSSTGDSSNEGFIY